MPFNTQGHYFADLLRHASPGSGGFLPALTQQQHLNMSASFDRLVVVGGWIGAALLALATRRQLAIGREKNEFGVIG
jgi:hypothetical protein